MSSHIYIAGAFKTVTRSKCKPNKDELDNDPHFWEMPPTWGICRTDFRNTTGVGDYVFFVLPLDGELPQTIFGYMKAKEIITHEEAFNRTELRKKRMGKKNPNGNIIVDSKGRYNKYDNGVHEDKFDKIKELYIIGDEKDHAFLGEKQIYESRKTFLETLRSVSGRKGKRAVDIIGRKGMVLDADQVKELKKWVDGF